MIRYDNFIESPFNDWQQIDIIVSRDCTLRCTYCYLHKSGDKTYNIDAMMQSLEEIICECEQQDTKGIVLSFYPEAWVNVERTNMLISRSMEIILRHPKYISNYMIMIGTNGVNLHKPIQMLEGLKNHLSLAVTLDGVKEQHDMYRVFPDGSPSWEIVKRNILENQEKYRIYHTKVTLGPDTLKYIYESTLFLWDEMHFNDINMNVVFEDLWGDRLDESLKLFEQQLVLLYDDIIKNRRWQKQQFQGLLGSRHIAPSKFTEKIEFKEYCEIARPYCGATRMRSIDSDGKIYPCFRLSPYSLQGDTTFGIKEEEEKRRTLLLLNTFDQVNEKCRNCDLLAVCSMCVGGAYEEGNSIYYRTTHHCEFQKLQSEYSYKLYKKINEIEGNI